MRLIQLPKRTEGILRGMPERLVLRDITQFKPSGRSLKPKQYGQGYVFRTNPLLSYPDSQLQTLLRVIYDDKSPEHCYRDFLYHTIPNSQMEYRLESGIVDIKTPTQVIEVKKAPQWKHALGQVLSYSFETNLLPAVALIGPVPKIAQDIIQFYQVEIIKLP